MPNERVTHINFIWGLSLQLNTFISTGGGARQISSRLMALKLKLSQFFFFALPLMKWMEGNGRKTFRQFVNVVILYLVDGWIYTHLILCKYPHLVPDQPWLWCVLWIITFSRPTFDLRTVWNGKRMASQLLPSPTRSCSGVCSVCPQRKQTNQSGITICHWTNVITMAAMTKAYRPQCFFPPFHYSLVLFLSVDFPWMPTSHRIWFRFVWNAKFIFKLWGHTLPICFVRNVSTFLSMKPTTGSGPAHSGDWMTRRRWVGR